MKLLILLILVSCSSTVATQTSPDVLYKRDMILTVNGKTSEGIAVADQSSNYKMVIQSKGDLELFVMTTCHRDWTKESAWDVTYEHVFLGFGKRKIENKRQITFEYIPTELEKGYCPMWLGGYDKEKKNSWGFVDFKDNKTTLDATLQCNGETLASNGVAVCQNRVDLYTKISFPLEVITAPDAQCDIGQNKGKDFTFQIKKGFCVYRFRANDGSKKEFRLTTIGYENILIRGEK